MDIIPTLLLVLNEADEDASGDRTMFGTLLRQECRHSAYIIILNCVEGSPKFFNCKIQSIFEIRSKVCEKQFIKWNQCEEKYNL